MNQDFECPRCGHCCKSELEDASAEMLMETGDKNYYVEAIAVLRQALVDADDISEKRVDEMVKTEHEPVCAHGVEKTKCDFCQLKQEPVAWTPQVWRQFRPDGTLEFQKIKRTPNGEWEDYTAPPKRDLTCVCGAVWEGEMMVHPPRKREWISLTDEEIAQGPQEVLPALYGRRGWAEKEAFEAVVAWAEAKLKEKNT